MSILRSQQVDLYEIMIPKDNDWDIMNELGKINCLHFVDLNKGEQPHHLRYFDQVRRGEEAELLIEQYIDCLPSFRELERVCSQYNVGMKEPTSVDSFLQQMKMYTEERGKASHLLFNDIENDLQEKVQFLQQQQQGLDRMVQMYKGMIAKINVLQHAREIFRSEIQSEEQRLMRTQSDSESPMIISQRQEMSSPLLSDAMRIIYIGGTLKKTDQMSFKRMLFRATRGKAYTQFFNIELRPMDMIQETKNIQKDLVYLIMFQEGGFMREKIQKICSSVSDTVFEISKNEIDRQLSSLEIQKNDTRVLISETRKQLKEYLVSINRMQRSDYSLIEIYRWFILKEKSIYIELNKLKDSEKILMGLFWCPTKLKSVLEEKVYDIRSRRNIEGPQIHQIKAFNEDVFKRPTFIETNDFTWPFQEIVNTYGVPTYQEINPAIFTIVTFPFLFGVMFGDIMHGLILLVFATYLCFVKAQPNSMIAELAKIRYLLLLMGFFSTYCGFIYNDFTSVPFYLFGDSCYTTDHATNQVSMKQDCVYPVGVDPKWYMAKNELSYFNSLKMKLSVILGVAQMCLGIFMKAFNSFHFKRPIDFTFEFLPQIILLLCLFGFMDLMIIVKWLTDFSVIPGAKPPSIITQMITMCLGFGEQNDPKLNETPLFSHQSLIMKTLLIIAIITVPLMLFVKPIHENNKLKKQQREKIIIDQDGQEKMYAAINDEPRPDYERERQNRSDIELVSIENKEDTEGKKVHGFGDLFIHQLIETIEFVLGTVSNTASYLRLWALSLAHSQLAKVFFDNTLIPGLRTNSFVILFIWFFVFLAFTISVIMLMDLMEAFLHTLRLHWVEFQNKFYKGGGILFQPFSIESSLKNAQHKKTEKVKIKKDQEHE